MPRAETLILAWGLALLAAAAGMAAWSWSETAKTRDWQRVEGRVIETRTQFQHSQARYGVSLTWTPVVRYAYEVDGRRLTGVRVYPGTPRQWSDEAELTDFLAETYPPGAPVTVHYDPADPRMAALLIESDYTWTWILGGTGLWFAFLGWGLRRLERRRQ